MAEIIEVSSPPSEPDSELAPSEADEDSSDEDFEDKFKEVVCDYLFGLRKSLDFAACDRLDNPHNPGLTLKCGGIVGLPLSDRDAEAIKSCSRARISKIGAGDLSSGKTWELSEGDFTLQNPLWQVSLTVAVERAITRLGLSEDAKQISVKLDKLLLHEEGAVSKCIEHSKTERNSFGTILILFPTKREGGDISFTNAEVTVKSGTYSDYDYMCAAWFSDVKHELQPVISGRRLALSYQLIHTGIRHDGLSANCAKTVPMLKSVFDWWKKHPDFDSRPGLAYILENRYLKPSQEVLSVNKLEGRDQQIVANLRQACMQTDFNIYLAQVEYQVSGDSCTHKSYYNSHRHYRSAWGYDDEDSGMDSSGSSNEHHEIEDVHNRDTTLKNVVSLDGEIVAKSLDFEEEGFFQSNPFDDMEPDAEDYLRGESCDTTHYYRPSVVLVMPKSHRAEFFFDSCRNHGNAIDMEILKHTSALKSDPHSTMARDHLEQICHMVIRQLKGFNRYRKLSPHPPFSDEVLVQVMKATVYIDQKDIFLDLYQICSNTVPKTMASACQVIASQFLRYDLYYKLPSLSVTLGKIHVYAQRAQILENLRAGFNKSISAYPTDNAPVYQAWLSSEIFESLASTPVRSIHEGFYLTTLSSRLPSQDVFDHILPAVKRNIHHVPMAVTFLINLSTKGGNKDEPGIAENVARTIFKDVISDLAEIFTLRAFAGLPTEALRNKPALSNLLSVQFGQKAKKEEPERAGAEQPKSKRIAILLCQCFEYSLTSELEKLINNISAESLTYPVEGFEELYIPMLKHLLQAVKEKGISLKELCLQSLFRNILGSYVVRYVATMPVQPTNWARPPKGDGCLDCRALDIFLTNAHVQSEEYRLNMVRQRHIRTRLQPSTGFQIQERNYRRAPHGIIITKINDEYNRNYAKWHSRYKIASAQIQQFGEDLVPLIGDPVLYGHIINLAADKLAHLGPLPQSTREALAPAMDNTNHGEPSRPRKVPRLDSEVIVLD